MALGGEDLPDLAAKDSSYGTPCVILIDCHFTAYSRVSRLPANYSLLPMLGYGKPQQGAVH